ncbi:hypothetical protein RI844_07030 [Thalassotalea fonticola]|uniref:SH3 domain-containing protein n=1 Tax=Thalassotalea fonticola TaxID=3065649 RepID=A0ABZ0GT76_9GAMM|nr:hypothetical protein RI844_07030 [Colwelliaceae bacterium S1-1]
MTDTLAAAQIRQINASAAKEESEAKKLNYEVEQAMSENKLPFYRRSWFVKSAVAGILIFSFLVGYIELIFLPAQEKLRQETDNANYILRQNEAEFSAVKARLELLLEQTKMEAIKAEQQNQLAILQLTQAKDSLNIMRVQIAKTEQKPRFKAASKALNKQLKDINTAQENIAQQSARLSTLNTEIVSIADKATVTEGWIYLGHFPDNNWTIKNIDIANNQSAKQNSRYKLTNDINVRNQQPKFSFSGYKFGAIKGNLNAGQTVKIIGKPIKVGFSKVWAKVKVERK